MKKITAVGFVAIGILVGSYVSKNLGTPAIAQLGPSTQSTGDALWHLPKFGEQGWFIHAQGERNWLEGGTPLFELGVTSFVK